MNLNVTHRHTELDCWSQWWE